MTHVSRWEFQVIWVNYNTYNFNLNLLFDTKNDYERLDITKILMVNKLKYTFNAINQELWQNNN